MNGSWERIYTEQGRVQLDVLDTALEARDLFLQHEYSDVLDLGCGTGRHTLMLADADFNVHACDISTAGIELTKKLITDAGYSNVSYSIQDMYKLNIKPNSIDGILCIWVQGHGTREDIARGIQEAYKVLKAGGMFYTDFITTDDVMYGIGEEIAADTFVGGRPGEEGVLHYYTTVEELRKFFADYDEVKIKDKTYRFHDNQGNEHIIEAAVVIALK